MDPIVLSWVLLAAVLHASWNALVKTGGDALTRLAIIHAVSSLAALTLIPFLDPPAIASWPFLAGSVAVHQAYYLFLLLGYRVGDLSHVYPLARGSAPLLVALGAFFFAGEKLSIGGAVAVGIICLAILSLGFQRNQTALAAKATVYALATGLSIAGYTVLDGLGGRLSGDVLSYIAWLFFLEGIPLAVIATVARRGVLLGTLRQHVLTGTAGGLFSIAAYGIVIWAMSRTPMTYVSALRETSVIIATLIGAHLLHEPYGRRRIGAAVMVVVGVVLLELSRTG